MAGGVPDHQGPAGARDAAGQALADLDARLRRHARAVVERARDDQLVAVHQAEAHPVGVDEAAAHVDDPPEQGVELLHPGQVAADLDEALQPGFAGAGVAQGLLEAGRHRVEGAHGGSHLAQLGLRHPGGEIAAPEPRRALGEGPHRAQAHEQDHVGEAEQGHQQHPGHRDHGADLGPELALQALHRGGDREDAVDDRRRRDRHPVRLERHRHQVLDPAGRPGAAEILRGRVEDDPVPVGLVEGHQAPHRVRVQVPQRLLRAREVADHQRVEQQRTGRGGEPLGLLAQPHLGRRAPIAEVDREAAQRDDDDRHARDPEEKRAEAGLHWPISRYTRRTPS